MEYLIGLDIGTSSVKGVLMTVQGAVKKTVRVPFSYLPLGPGRSELDPEAYLNVCYEALRTLSECSDGTILGVTASSASGNLILVDEDGQPLTNIICWQDQRVDKEGFEVLSGISAEEIYRSVGWPFDFKGMPLAELCYLKVYSPELLCKAKTVAMSTEYLNYSLTGEWGISPSNGVTFYLVDRNTKTYMKPILDRIGITKDQLPCIKNSGTMLGAVTQEASKACGLPEGTPIVIGSFDHPSAARGAGVLHEGELLLSCGTSWVAFYPVNDPEKAFLLDGLVDPFLSPNGCYGVMTSIESLSARIEYYAKRFIGGDNVFSRMSELALQSIPGAHGLRIDLMSEPDETTIASFERKDVARSIMEATVRLLKEQLDLYRANGIGAERAVMVGGPSEDPVWRRLIEETCVLKVETRHGSYAGAVGAAILSGIGAGVFENEEAALRNMR